MPAAPPMPRARRLARLLWPVGLLLLALPAFAELLLIDSYDASTPTLILTSVVPAVAAIAFTAYAIGGRRGAAVGLGLTGLVAYWAWWFGWGLDYNISPFSLGLAAAGLVDATVYHLALAILLWPIVLAAAVIVALMARRRGWRIWPALGVAALAAVVLALPTRAEWDDGCNSGDGASPLITHPVAERLMDLGVGVTPGPSQTAMYCPDVGDRTWKPFWLGPDGLPPSPHSIYPLMQESLRVQVPEQLATPPDPAG